MIKHNKHDLDKAFVNPIDRALFEFDAKNPKSASQMKEIKKHQRIATLRDNPNASEEQAALWEAF